MYLIFLLYLLLASTFTLAKAALYFGQPLFIIAIRMLIAGSMLLCYVWLKERHTFNRSLPLYLFLQITLFHIYGAYVFEFYGLQHVTSAKTCLLYNLVPFITALFSYLSYKYVLSGKQWLALVIGFLGFFPILLSQAPSEQMHGSYFFISKPELFILISVVCSAQGWIVMHQLMRTYQYCPLFINGFGMFTGGLLALLHSFKLDGIPAIHAQSGAWDLPINQFLLPWLGMSPHAFFWFYIILLIIVANFICYNLYGYLLKKYSPTLIAFFGFSSPFFAAVYGCILLHEKVNCWFVLSACFVGIALYLFYREEVPLIQEKTPSQ